MPNMLLCVPQDDLAAAMQEYFGTDNYVVEQEANGLRALELLRQKHYDVIVLEISLHGLDGLGVVRDYRAGGGNSPIILLTGKVSSDELQVAFAAGADAYIVKPFLLKDFAAQLRAMMRRPMLRNKPVLTLGNLVLDTHDGRVSKDDRAIQLRPMEFRLLHFLMSHPDQVFDARALFERVWQKSSDNMSDTVRTHIRTLRNKIDTGGRPSFIRTVRGLGYKTGGDDSDRSSLSVIST